MRVETLTILRQLCTVGFRLAYRTSCAAIQRVPKVNDIHFLVVIALIGIQYLHSINI